MEQTPPPVRLEKVHDSSDICRMLRRILTNLTSLKSKITLFLENSTPEKKLKNIYKNSPK
jgi:hypothetical protein